MCQVHMYRASCGHLSLLEPVSPNQGATVFCQKNPPCKRPTIEVATLFSMCSECHARIARMSAVPSMHRVDISKFKTRKYRAPESTEPSKQFPGTLTESYRGFRSRVWKKLRGHTSFANRQRSRPAVQPSQFQRQTQFDDTNGLGFYDLI
ncbi:hypothetical protein TWF281_001043 [Arthrobotrys megalospora]